jgi:hypothetical protein
MQKQAAFAKGEDDLAAANLFERAGGDLSHVAGPESRQHALAAKLQS